MLTCKCGSKLEWEDTSDVEGGILEGYIIEQQLWTCPNCQTEYFVQARVNFKESDIEIDQVLENI